MSHSTRHAVTDQEIQKWVARHHGFVPESYWIAHCKQLCGLVTGQPESREWQQCPLDKQSAIKQAFRHFGIVSDPS